MYLIYGTLTSMATKKIVVSDQPEEPEVPATPPADETSANESEAAEASSTDTQETQQSDTEASEPSESPDVVPPEQSEAPSDAESPKHDGLKALHFPKGRSAVLIGLAVIAVIVGAYFLLKPNYTDPLPKTVTKQATTFTVYYPQSSSNAYTYAPNSATYADNKLSYTVTLKNTHSAEGANPFVHVSEQALVGKGPDLTQLPSFTVFNAPAGKAAVSPDGQVVNGVLVTDKTLVILNGLGGVTQQQLEQIIKSM